MKRLLILLSLLFAIPANAAISRDGSVAVAATSGTFSATAEGDLKIIFSFRTSSATPPTLPSGWTSITTRVQGTRSVRIGCNISSTSGDRGTGIWTNATDIIGVSYAGTAAGTSGMSCLSAIGQFATNSASSATVNFPALATMLNDNTSWVVGFSAGVTSLAAAPTNMTSVTTIGNLRASDTNTTTTSWTSQNVTVTSQVWLTGTLEISAPAIPIPGAACSSSIPCLVQSYSGASNQGFETGNSFTFSMPNPVSSASSSQNNSGNNLLVCGITYASGVTPTVTDNQSNTWTAGTAVNSGNNEEQLFWAAGVKSGTQTITVTFGSAIFFFQPHCDEFYNVLATSPLDVQSGTASVTGPLVTAGSLTTTGTNELVVQYGNVDDNGPGNALSITTVDVGSGFIDDGADDTASGTAQFFQHRVQPAVGTLNPTFGFAQPTANTFGSVAAAFKSSTNGTIPASGIRILHEYAAIVSQVPSTTMLFPANGNLIVAAFSILTSQITVGVSDNLGNTYTLENPAAATCSGATPASTPQIFHADNATTNNALTLTVTQNNNSGVTEVSMYDIIGAATAPFDKDSCSAANASITTTTTQSRISTDTSVTVASGTGFANGDFIGWASATTPESILLNTGGGSGTFSSITRAQQLSTAVSHASGTSMFDYSIHNAPSITPTTSNGLVIGVLELGVGPVYNVVGTNYVSDTIWYLGQTDASKTNAGEGHFHYYNPNTSAVVGAYTLDNQAQDNGGFVALATAFKAPAASKANGKAIVF